MGKSSAMEKAKAYANFKSIAERIQSEPIAWSKQEAPRSDAAQWLARAILDDDEFNQWQEDIAIAKIAAPETAPVDPVQHNAKPTKASLAAAIRQRL